MCVCVGVPWEDLLLVSTKVDPTDMPKRDVARQFRDKDPTGYTVGAV